jgi:ribonuclease P protein component
LIKRRIKEAYRKNKHILYNFLASEKLNIAFIMIYRGTEIPDYTSVEKSVNEIILKLCDDIRKKLVKC